MANAVGSHMLCPPQTQKQTSTSVGLLSSAKQHTPVTSKHSECLPGAVTLLQRYPTGGRLRAASSWTRTSAVPLIQGRGLGR